MVIVAVKEVSNAVHIMLPEQSPHLQPSIDMSAVQLPSPNLIQSHEQSFNQSDREGEVLSHHVGYSFDQRLAHQALQRPLSVQQDMPLPGMSHPEQVVGASSHEQPRTAMHRPSVMRQLVALDLQPAVQGDALTPAQTETPERPSIARGQVAFAAVQSHLRLPHFLRVLFVGKARCSLERNSGERAVDVAAPDLTRQQSGLGSKRRVHCACPSSSYATQSMTYGDELTGLLGSHKGLLSPLAETTAAAAVSVNHRDTALSPVPVVDKLSFMSGDLHEGWGIKQALVALAEGQLRCAVIGDAFKLLLQLPDESVLQTVLQSAVVFARMSPHQKGQVVSLLNRRGLYQMHNGQQRHIQACCSCSKTTLVSAQILLLLSNVLATPVSNAHVKLMIT